MAIATASAVVSVWVSDSSHCTMPNSAAISAARPCNATEGAPLRGLRDFDVAQLELPQADAHRLHHGFLRPESRGEALRRVLLAAGVRTFRVAEQPLEQAIALTRHRQPESLHLDQIGAEPHDLHPHHDTTRRFSAR